MKKISILGAGNVGREAAAAIFRLSTSRITLIDKVAGLAEGRAMDIRQSAHLVTTCSLLRGSEQVQDIRDSDLIIISAGAPRKAGMSRLDLLNINRAIILELGEAIAAYAPHAVTLIVSNPVDLLTTFFKRSFPDLKVFGFGCSLDSFRYRSFIGEKLDVNPSNVTGLIIGSHDPEMIPYLPGTSVGGVPVTELLTAKELEKIHLKTIAAGTEIVKQLKTTGSSYTAGQIVAHMARCVIEEIPDIFSVDVYLTGENGFSGVALSLPCIIGKNGVQQVIELPRYGDYYARLKCIADGMLEIAGKKV